MKLNKKFQGVWNELMVEVDDKINTFDYIDVSCRNYEKVIKRHNEKNNADYYVSISHNDDSFIHYSYYCIDSNKEYIQLTNYDVFFFDGGKGELK